MQHTPKKQAKQTEKQKEQKRNYKRLYFLVGKVRELDPTIEAEQFIRGWIWQETKERTYHKSELTGEEYDRICRDIAKRYGLKDEYFEAVERQRVELELKKRRSAVLKRLQKIGIDTTEWKNVNDYLRSPRIAGKALYELDAQELEALIPKLESILKKQKDEKDT